MSDLQYAAQAIRSADALLITAGAGMGVDSGLPDFRGNEGFWKAYPVVARLGLSFAEMANPQWFKARPELAWAFYGHRLNLYRKTQPHTGFTTLFRWAQQMPAGYFVFTSNVDGQFQKAGFDPDRIEECHGSIHHFQCVDGCTPSIWNADDEQISVDEERFRAHEPLPKCRMCGNMARPNIMMFGDYSWLNSRHKTQNGRFNNWFRSLMQSQSKLVVIELGAGTAIPTVRHTSERIANRLQGHLIRINPREADTLSEHFGITAGALEGIQRLKDALGNGFK